VLKDAIGASSLAVRRNVAALLGSEPASERLHDLVELAVSDQNEAVRRAAAVSLTKLDRPELYAEVVEGLHKPASYDGALKALSRIRIAADGSVPAHSFEASFSRLDRSERGRIRRSAQMMRLKEGLPILAFAVVPAVILASISAAGFKWLPATFNWALCQANPSPAMGVFHGLTAGVLWAGLIVLGLSVYRVVFGRDQDRGSYLKPFAAISVGGVCGFVASLLVILIIVSVYEITSLQVMGWLTEDISSSDRFAGIFWRDLFVETRFGWPYLITGTGLGVGMALMTNALHASRRWAEFLKQQTRLTGAKQTVRLIRGITRVALFYAWPLPVMLIVAGVLAFAVPSVPHEYPSKASSEFLVLGLIGDCATKAIGAFFAIVGMGLGLVVMRYGVHAEARKRW